MGENTGFSERQLAIIEKIFGAAGRPEGDAIVIGDRKIPVRDGVILLDEAVGAGEALKGDVIRSFGNEWQAFADLKPEHQLEFDCYFDVVNVPQLSGKSVIDLGCGMGRWSRILMDRTTPDFLVCVDLSDAIFVARENLRDRDNVLFIKADLERLTFPGFRFDFAFSLGVLHHIPAGIETAVGNIHGYAARFLCYLYYSLENRGLAFRLLFGAATLVRKVLSSIGHEGSRRFLSWLIAVFVYKPLTLIADLAGALGLNKERVPLNAYCGFSIGRIQQDAYDRFFTKVEHRFSRADIRRIFSPYWDDVRISDIQPFWHFLCDGRRERQ